MCGAFHDGLILAVYLGSGILRSVHVHVPTVVLFSFPSFNSCYSEGSSSFDVGMGQQGGANSTRTVPMASDKTGTRTNLADHYNRLVLMKT